MGRHTGVALYVLALIPIVVGVDVLFFSASHVSQPQPGLSHMGGGLRRLR